MRSFAHRMNVQLETVAEKKRTIFKSTMRLVKEFGFHGTPMSQIALEAEVATGTIYHYFVSKEELLVELFAYCREEIGEAIFKADEEDASYPLRFIAIWTNLVKFYIQYPEVLSFLEQFFSSPYIKMVYGENGVCYQDKLSDFFHLGVSEGHIKPLDVNIISAAFTGTVSATAKRHINGHFTFEEEDLKKTVGIIWDGIKIA